MTLNDHVYLAQVQDGRYLVRIDAGRNEVEITDYPSVAWHGPYAEIEQAVQKLRRRGFRQAVVTNAVGAPISADDLREAMANERAATPAPAPLPRNVSDVDKISASELRKRMKANPAYAQKVADIYRAAGR